MADQDNKIAIAGHIIVLVVGLLAAGIAIYSVRSLYAITAASELSREMEFQFWRLNKLDRIHSLVYSYKAKSEEKHIPDSLDNISGFPVESIIATLTNVKAEKVKFAEIVAACAENRFLFYDSNRTMIEELHKNLIGGKFLLSFEKKLLMELDKTYPDDAREYCRRNKISLELIFDSHASADKNHYYYILEDINRNTLFMCIDKEMDNATRFLSAKAGLPNSTKQ